MRAKFPKKTMLNIPNGSWQNTSKEDNIPSLSNTKTSMKNQNQNQNKGENQNRIQNFKQRHSRKDVYEVGIPE